VLFITLGILLTLSTVVFLFLRQSSELKKSVRQNIAIVQTNLILYDMSGYLKTQNFTQDDIFYGAGIPVSLDLGPVSGTLTLDSARRRININKVLQALQKDQLALDSFRAWMVFHHIRFPNFFLALLLDTYDADLYERQPGSEIRLREPRFQNGAIYDSRAMEEILLAYAAHTGDHGITLEKWEEIFGYEGETLDLNYATTDQLMLLYPDFSPGSIERLAAHNNRYENADDLPIAEEYKAEVLQPRLGVTPTLSSDAVAVAIDYNTTQECSGSLSFQMALKKKKITLLTLSPLACP
jgi:hypothetical protein